MASPTDPLATSHYPGHSLEQQATAALMNRVDSKFMMPVAELAECLAQLDGEYSVLDIQGQRWFHYDTLYFDTRGLAFYHAHHNGKLNRFKVRTRHYREMNRTFLEIKVKNNQRRTVKHRIELIDNEAQSDEILHFLHSQSGLSVARMVPTLFVHYRRATLMSADRRERVTLDVDLQFHCADNSQQVDLPGVALMEVKCDRKHGDSAMTRVLKQHGLRPVNFSKYCIGTGLLLGNRVKTNTFKPVLTRLERLLQTTRTPHGIFS